MKITCVLLPSPMQKVFFIPYACWLCGPFVALHTWRQYLTLSHTVKEITPRGILELCLMLQLLEEKPQVIFQYDRVPLTYTVRWHSWAGNCLDGGLIEAGSAVWSLWSLLDFLLWWFCEIRMYRISQPIKRAFFPEKCDLNSTCVLCAEGKYYFQTYKYLYIYYTTSLSWDSEICFQIIRSGITAC